MGLVIDYEEARYILREEFSNAEAERTRRAMQAEISPSDTKVR
ncbi:MAG TPA: hypothetical protein VEF34_18980 [Syntrophobacteraceae bacterium]|nr:hypothetical protein [Syntrophobacteraceae bacterium]